MKYIAVDFDGTLCEHKFPEIGPMLDVHKSIRSYLQVMKKNGNVIILWTCRENTEERKYLDEAIEWCKKNDIPIDYINENPECQFASNHRKIIADFYIDDKSITLDMIENLFKKEETR